MTKRILAALLLLALAVPVAQALDYPKGPITLVCPWAPGGSSDLSCRMIAQLFRKHTGKTMNVVNRPGGNGTVQWNDMAMTGKPDGYTLSLVSSGGMTALPLIQDVEYTLDTFTFIIGTTSEPLAVIVAQDSELKSLQDIVDRYNKDKKPVTFAMSGINGATYLNTLVMFKNMNVECQVVPYAGGSEALTAVLGGEAEMCIIHPGQAVSPLDSGDVRQIAMIYRQRPPSFPDVPTVKEQGFGEVHSEVFKAILCLSDVDPEIVKYLNDGIRKVYADPEWANFLKVNGLEATLYHDDASYRNAIKKEIMAVWPVIQSLGIAKPNAVAPDYKF